MLVFDELAATPLTGFFEPQQYPRFFLNPVLLDAVGHLTAFWIAQSHGTDFSSFPSSIARIDLVDPAAEETEGCVGRGRLAFVESNGQQGRFLEGDFEIEDPQGQPLIRIRGWRDRFFNVPHSFYFARSNPRDGWYGEDWSELYPERPEDLIVWHVPPFPPGFLEDAGALWKRLLVYTVLGREERDVWQTLPANPRRRSEWLMGRIALKEVTRWWIARRYGVLLYPADVVIRTDAAGKPYVAGDGLESLGPMPQVSVAHADGDSVAVAGVADREVGIDLELFGRIRLPDFVSGAFTDAEASHVRAAPESRREEVALRMWCAKEAAAKSLGMGLNGRPSLFQITQLLDNGGLAVVETQDVQVSVSIREYDGKIIAVANG
jgi:phosphopantetheinyl transferase